MIPSYQLRGGGNMAGIWVELFEQCGLISLSGDVVITR
jgi:hypothetical protein